MLISRIQKDLFDFIDSDPDEREGLVEFWYRANSEALSAALTKDDGLKLIINVQSFESFELLSKKLFLIADTLILRDTRQWTREETDFRTIPIPQDYQPGYYADVIDDLKLLRPSPLTHLYRPNLYLTSTTKKLNNGYLATYAGWDYNSIPTQFVDWISGSGRPYLETGRIVYAPFIPTLEMELEFLRNGVSVPQSFNASPCFHQKYDWLNDRSFNALFSLSLPFLDNIDIETIAKVKEDNYDEFRTFSRTILDSVANVKSAIYTEEFTKEVRQIQRNQIDAGLNDINKTMGRVSKMKTLRDMGVLAGLIGLNAAIMLGAPGPAIVSGLAASGVALVAKKIADMKERNELKDKSPYFLWKLQQRIKTR
jgi:hypothetical protein